jgi:hypothetical protein
MKTRSLFFLILVAFLIGRGYSEEVDWKSDSKELYTQEVVETFEGICNF